MERESRQRTILVIDDSAPMRDVIREALESAGYEVLDAPDGAYGASYMSVHPADLVIVDLFMPRMDGVETIREIRREFPEVPIITISGAESRGMKALLEVARKLGSEVEFSKPFPMEDLVAAVDRLLG